MPDLRVRTSDDLRNTSEAQTHHVSDCSIRHPGGVGLADGRIAPLTRSLVPLDGPTERLGMVGHKVSVENLTTNSNPCRFIHMPTTHTAGQKATYWHSMLGRDISVTIRRTDRRGYVWIELPNGNVRRVKAMWVS